MGPDKIHGLVLKNCAKNISKPLSILFSKSLYSGAIPDEWKAALVVPVHKKGAKSKVSNYRPISLTCIIMKVMEIIVRDEIMLRSGHFIDNRQHGCLLQFIKAYLKDSPVIRNWWIFVIVWLCHLIKIFAQMQYTLILLKLLIL